jgi:hypothetical protein
LFLLNSHIMQHFLHHHNAIIDMSHFDKVSATLD